MSSSKSNSAKMSSVLMDFKSLKFYVSNPAKWDKPMSSDETTLEVFFGNIRQKLRLDIRGDTIVIAYIIGFFEKGRWVDFVYIPVLDFKLSSVDDSFLESDYVRFIKELQDRDLFYRDLGRNTEITSYSIAILLKHYTPYAVIGYESGVYTVIDITDSVKERYLGADLKQMVKSGIKIAGVSRTKSAYSKSVWTIEPFKPVEFKVCF